MAYRTYHETAKYLFEGTLIPQRFPIGIEPVIKDATRRDFVDYYQKWYHADNMVLLIVGDLNPAEMKPLVLDKFTGLRSVENPRSAPEIGTPVIRELGSFYHYEAEAAETEVGIFSMTPKKRPADSAKTRLDGMKAQIANQILAKRLEKLKKPGFPLLSSSNYHYAYFGQFYVSGIEAKTKPEQFAEGMVLIENELRKALEYGFLSSEFEEARANTLNALKQSASSASTRLNRNLASTLTSHFSDHKVFVHPADFLKIAQPYLEALTVAQIDAAFRDSWNPESREVVVTGNLELDPEEAPALILAGVRPNSSPRNLSARSSGCGTLCLHQ